MIVNRLPHEGNERPAQRVCLWMQPHLQRVDTPRGDVNAAVKPLFFKGESVETLPPVVRGIIILANDALRALQVLNHRPVEYTCLSDC